TPSRCRPPVNSTQTVSAKNAAAQGLKNDCPKVSTLATATPSTSPTPGNQNTDLASVAAWKSAFGTGTRVRKPTASHNAAIITQAYRRGCCSRIYSPRRHRRRCASKLGSSVFVVDEQPHEKPSAGRRRRNHARAHARVSTVRG